MTILPQLKGLPRPFLSENVSNWPSFGKKRLQEVFGRGLEGVAQKSDILTP